MPIQPELKITIAMDDRSIGEALFKAEDAFNKVKKFHEEAEKTGKISDVTQYRESKKEATSYFNELTKMKKDFNKTTTQIEKETFKEIEKMSFQSEEEKEYRRKELFDKKLREKYQKRELIDSLYDVEEFVEGSQRDIKSKYVAPGGGDNRTNLNQLGGIINNFSQMFMPGMPIGSFMGRLGIWGGLAAMAYKGIDYAMKTEENYRDFTKELYKTVVMPYGRSVGHSLGPGGVSIEDLRKSIMQGTDFGYATPTEIMAAMGAARQAAPTQAGQMVELAKMGVRGSNLGYGDAASTAAFFSRMRFMGGATDSDRLMRQMEAWRQSTGYSPEHVMPMMQQIVQGLVSSTGGPANMNQVMGLLQGMAGVGPQGIGEMGAANLQRINQGMTGGPGRQFLFAEYARQGKSLTDIMDLVEQGANNPENLLTMKRLAGQNATTPGDQDMFYRLFMNLNAGQRKLIKGLPTNLNPEEVSNGQWKTILNEFKETDYGKIKEQEILAETGQLQTGEKAFRDIFSSKRGLQNLFHLVEGGTLPQMADNFLAINNQSEPMAKNFEKLNEELVKMLVQTEAKKTEQINKSAQKAHDKFRTDSRRLGFAR